MGLIDIGKGILCLIIGIGFLLAFFSSSNIWALLIGVWFLIFGIAFFVQYYRNN